MANFDYNIMVEDQSVTTRDLARTTFTVNNNLNFSVDGATVSGREFLNLKPLAGDFYQDRYYNITIDVYEGKGTTYAGAATEDFPDEIRISSFTGALKL